MENTWVGNGIGAKVAAFNLLADHREGGQQMKKQWR